MHRRLTIAALTVLLISACARPPATLRGDDFAPIKVRDAQQSDQGGVRVRWGGTIARVQTEKSETCFEIVSRPLSREARPRRTDHTDGRFLACQAGFFDPEVFAKSREVTVIGTLRDVVENKIGDYDYRFPRLAAETVYLWPERQDPPAAYYGPAPYYWDPWIWGPPAYPWYYRARPYRYQRY